MDNTFTENIPAEQAIKKVDLGDVLNLGKDEWGFKLLIVPSDDPYCIYKKLGINNYPNRILLLNNYKQNAWGKTCTISLTSRYNLQYYNDTDRVKVTDQNGLYDGSVVKEGWPDENDRWYCKSPILSSKYPIDIADGTVLINYWEYFSEYNPHDVLSDNISIRHEKNSTYWVKVFTSEMLVKIDLNEPKELSKHYCSDSIYVEKDSDIDIQRIIDDKLRPDGVNLKTFSTQWLLKNPFFEAPDKTPSLKKTWLACEKHFKDLYKEYPIEWYFVKEMFESGNKTIDSLKVSKALNMILSEGTREQVESLLLQFRKYHIFSKYSSYVWNDFFQDWLPKRNKKVFEIKKAEVKKKATGATNRIMKDMEFVDINPAKYPKTYKALTEGDIPLSTIFSTRDKQYFTQNDNWSLWERMLTDHYDTTIQLANLVAPRTTYGKELMSYFYFVLESLPNYLNKHTGYEWTCSPKTVTSEHELDESRQASGGTVKKRSALTPIVDNDKKHVTVPYVSMKMHGYGTTYCYAKDFNILREGMSFDGNVVTEEVERKLNGFDDYGLMFYTLTGSSTATGYPTFLIIFERVNSDKTVVHFHRVHPSRSKQCDYNPIHNWIKTCYKWMIGNVKKESIVAQQGDLAFSKMEETARYNEEEMAYCDEYEGHRFSSPVKVLKDESSKTNCLGTVLVEQDVIIEHDEHKNRPLPRGCYKLMQCRSWEANPKGVWSLRID